MRRMQTAVAVLMICAGAAAANAQQKTLSVADKLDINDLYARYNQTLDEGDKEGFAATFTPDGAFSSGPRSFTGAKQVADGLINFPRRERPKVRHFISNLVVEATADGAKARVGAVLFDLQKSGYIAAGGYYDDTLVKTKDGWRFKKRVFNGEQVAPAEGAAK